MAWNLDFGLWQSIAAIKKARQYSIVVSPDPNERMLVELRMKRAYLWRPRARRREHRYFTPRRDSSRSACRPNARDAALLHVPQLEFMGHDPPVAQTLVVSCAGIRQYELVNSFAQ